MTVKLAMVQPKSFSRFMSASPEIFGPETPPEIENLNAAERYAEQAAATGAPIIVFPEFYPGPGYGPCEYTFDDVCTRMARKAQELGTYLFFGGVKPGNGRCWNAYSMADPRDGKVTTYAKMIPAIGELGEPGQSLGIFDIPLLKIGVSTCWEAWFPEVSRALALRGVDLILYPTGGLVYELRDRWKILIAARAAENLVYTASCINLFGVEAGLGYIFSPEKQLAENLEEGIHCAELDLERLRYLRSQDEAMTTPKMYRAIPGTLRALKPAVVEAYYEAASEAIGSH